MSDRYEIESLIGKGRTGGVYEALDTVLHRKVALRRFYSEQGDTDTSRWQDKFDYLTGYLSSLAHPNLATVYDAGIDDDGAYLTTEFAPHPTLDDRLLQGRLELDEFWAMATDILEALAVPHARDFTHSGLTTKSIILHPRSRGDVRYRIIDLGQAWLIPLINPDNPLLSLADPAIMAPELFEKHNPTPQTDVYMIGMLFYLALAGGHPFAGLPAEEAHERHLNHSLAPITGYRTSVPPEISDWLEILTQADPKLRPQNATEALNLLPLKSSINKAFFQTTTTSVPNFHSTNPAQHFQNTQAPYRPITQVQPVQPQQPQPGFVHQRPPSPPAPQKRLASADSSNSTLAVILVVI